MCCCVLGMALGSNCDTKEEVEEKTRRITPAGSGSIPPPRLRFMTAMYLHESSFFVRSATPPDVPTTPHGLGDIGQSSDFASFKIAC